MTKTISAAAVAALMAAVSFGAVAHAGGDYYEGAQKEASSTVGKPNAGGAAPAAIDSGDYYEGAARPN